MDLRDSFFNALYDISMHDKNFYFLTADMWAFSLKRYKENLGNRFINVGIAEQNMIGVAAGLAKSGNKVCAYTITPFITERCFEQIKIDICCSNLPVILVGIGAGLTYSYDGPTHHTTYDIAIMRTLPNLSIYSPSCPSLHSFIAKKVYKSNGPSYVRLDKGYYDKIYTNEYQFNDGVFFLNTGRDVLIISTGTNIYDVREVVKDLNDNGVEASYMDIFEIKPLNEERVVDIISKFKKIVVVEEHSRIGGIGSIVCELMTMNNVCRPLKRISLPDEFCKKYGDRNWIKKQYFLDKDSIVKTILEWDRKN